ncbi:MAG: sigma-70 family RNA polymerase sigma factor [Bacteroidota bacterium]
MKTSILYQKDRLETPETELIEEAKKDPEKFEPIYDRYFKQLFQFVFHRVADKSLAADLTSQVFLKALLNLKTYEHKGLPFSSWLYRIAINECNLHHRKSRTKQYVVLDDHNYNLMSEEMDLEREEDRVLLKKAISKLNTKEMEVIELRFFESLSFKEVAKILSITENNAKVKLYRALDKLKKLMNAYEK